MFLRKTLAPAMTRISELVRTEWSQEALNLYLKSHERDTGMFLNSLEGQQACLRLLPLCWLNSGHCSFHRLTPTGPDTCFPFRHSLVIKTYFYIIGVGCNFSIFFIFYLICSPMLSWQSSRALALLEAYSSMIGKEGHTLILLWTDRTREVQYLLLAENEHLSMHVRKFISSYWCASVSYFSRCFFPVGKG